MFFLSLVKSKLWTAKPLVFVFVTDLDSPESWRSNNSPKKLKKVKKKKVLEDEVTLKGQKLMTLTWWQLKLFGKFDFLPRKLGVS